MQSVPVTQMLCLASTACAVHFSVGVGAPSETHNPDLQSLSCLHAAPTATGTQTLGEAAVSHEFDVQSAFTLQMLFSASTACALQVLADALSAVHTPDVQSLSFEHGIVTPTV